MLITAETTAAAARPSATECAAGGARGSPYCRSDETAATQALAGTMIAIFFE